MMYPKTNYGIHRGQPTTINIRQHVSGRARTVDIRRLVKPIVIIIVLAVTNSLLATAILQWRIETKAVQLRELQNLQSQVNSDNISLLAQRAKLSTKEHVAKVAGEKLNLFVPDPDQVQHL